MDLQMEASPRIWTQSVYEAGYHQIVPSNKQYAISMNNNFHGNTVPLYKNSAWNKYMEPWKQNWHNQFSTKPNELSYKMAAGHSAMQTNVKPSGMQDYNVITIKPEIIDEDHLKWGNQVPSIQIKDEKIKNMKFENGVEAYGGQSAGFMTTNNELKINNMIAQVDPNIAISNFNDMSSLDLSSQNRHCASSESMMNNIGSVNEMTSFTETPPPSPPYTHLPSSVSSSNRNSIPTFLEDVQDQGKTYAVLQAPTPVKQRSLPSFPASMDTSTDADLSRWGKVHPIDWTSDEVMDFIYWLALNTTDEETIPDIDSSRLRRSSGLDLMQMSARDFQEFSPEYGQLFYNKFQGLLKQAEFDYSPNLMSLDDDFGPYGNGEDPCLNSLVIGMEKNPGAWNIMGHDYGFDPQDQFNGFPVGTIEHHVEETGYLSTDSNGSNSYSCSSDGHHHIPMIPMVTPNDYQQPMMAQRNMPSGHVQQPEKKRGPGRPRKIQPDGHPRPPCARGRKPGQTTKGNHLYEFILELLKSRNSNPNLVKWEDRENGVFRFVQSEKVAKMWGKKKNNPNMTYEKLSRAMRFCRSVGYFATLPRDRGFPKKLCFKFGEKAQNWQQTCDVFY